MSKYLGIVGRKNSILTERNLCQNLAWGGAAIRHEWLGVRG